LIFVLSLSFLIYPDHHFPKLLVLYVYIVYICLLIRVLILKRLIVTTIMLITLISLNVIAVTEDALWTGFYVSCFPEIAYSVKETPDGGDLEDVALSVVATYDNCFVVVGWTKSFGAGETDIYLIKIDASDDTLWTRTYGSPYEDIARCVQQTTDGGYVICSETDYMQTGYTAF